MGRQPCCDKIGLKRGPWAVEEDRKLMNFILNNGIQCWRTVPKLAGLLRCGKSCRLRWINYLRPDLKRGALSEVEENQIIELHRRLGNRWAKIASHFPGRTDNEIKNHWNTRIKKRLKLLGLDPLTQQPIEQKEQVEEKTESDVDPNRGNDQDVRKMIAGNDEIPAEAKDDQKSEAADMDTSGQTGSSIHLINNYEMMNRSLDTDLWLTNQEANYSTCYSPSFSVEDSVSYHNSMGGESTISTLEDGSKLQQWVGSVDSLLSWDGYNQFHQQLFFQGTGH